MHCWLLRLTGRLTVAEKLLTTVVGLTLDPTGGLITYLTGRTIPKDTDDVAKGVLSFIFKRISDPDLKKKFDKLKCDLARRVPKRLHDHIIADRAIEILETTFRGTPDLYEAKEKPENLARMLLARRPTLLLRESEKGKVCELLTALFETYRDFGEVITELERAFREDVLKRLDTLQRTVEADLRPYLEALIRWARTDILYDPRERLQGRNVDRAPSTLLDARYETVPFFGREAERAEFDAWLDAEDTFSVWIVAGAGGLGKTRLMLESVTRARAKGWRAGFLKREAERRDVEAGADALAGGPQNVLTVVDYAEDRPRLAAILLDRWWRDGGPKRRLVLLARSEHVLVDAVARLGSEDEAFRDAAGYLKGARTRRLTNLTLSLPERRRIFIHAQKAFLEKLETPPEKAYGEERLDATARRRRRVASEEHRAGARIVDGGGGGHAKRGGRGRPGRGPAS